MGPRQIAVRRNTAATGLQLGYERVIFGADFFRELTLGKPASFTQFAQPAPGLGAQFPCERGAPTLTVHPRLPALDLFSPHPLSATRGNLKPLDTRPTGLLM